MKFFTIDEYYDKSFFNQCKESLKNNGIDYKLFVNIKSPYNWYFRTEQTPIMVNYDVSTKQNLRWMVEIVRPVTPSDDFKLLRRNNDSGAKALAKFVENTPLKESRLSEYSVFFTIKNREEGIALSKIYHGKIWYMGTYYDNKYRVCLCSDRVIKGFLNPTRILLERQKEELDKTGQFEAELNYRVFKNNDTLFKYTSTPYFQGGAYKRPKIQNSGYDF